MRGFVILLILSYWPLLKNNGVSGTFCEYRYNHIHAGFDLSTKGKTGLAVRCFDDGFVYMIKVKKHGYGNVVYIKHPERKLISVYAHLKCFNGDIQKLAERYRALRKTRYPGLIVPEKRIKVKKGEIIGYSGESGEGLPHLHFELRDYNNNPVDASKFGFDMRFDNTYPFVSGLKVIPQDSFSSVNGKTKPLFVKAEKKGKNKFKLKPFTVSGIVLFSLNTYDTAGRGRVGVKSIEFYLNKNLVYKFSPYSFSFDTFKQACCVYDFGDTSLSPTRYFYNLFKVDGCRLGVSEMPLKYRFKKGKNTIKVVVSDFHGNKSVLEGSFLYKKFKGRPALFTPLSVVKDGRVVFAKDINTLLVFKDYAVFPYNTTLREYNYLNLKLLVSGINREKRLLRVSRGKDFKGFLIPVEGTFFNIERESEFIKRIRYCFTLENIDKRYGIYYYNRFKKRWVFIGDDIDKPSSTISANYYRAGIVGVFIDNVPPEIKTKPFYYDGKFVIKAYDIGKGIDEETIVFKSKKKGYPLEYDRDRRWLFYEGKVKKGKYLLEFSDLAGNRVSKAIEVK